MSILLLISAHDYYNYILVPDSFNHKKIKLYNLFEELLLCIYIFDSHYFNPVFNKAVDLTSIRKKNNIHVDL